MNMRKIKSLDEVKKYHADHFENWQKILYILDNTFVEARDNRSVPIYLTKARIKQPESAYLKFKRKRRDDPNRITDWIGFRVLCLFQQDIEPTYRLLLRIMFGLHPLHGSDPLSFKLKEINIFNWPQDKAIQLGGSLRDELEKGHLNNTIREKVDGLDVAYNKPMGDTIPFELRHINKGSGYQSVHFVVEIKRDGKPVAQCEIQLRTLLQDVWGELEHALSYKKGKIHPHIKNSFELLSRELAAKDTLVSQLRKIRDEETAFAHYANVSAGPIGFFSYPATYLDGLFPNESEKNLLAQYEKKCKNRKNSASSPNWLPETREILKELCKNFDATKGDNGAYFLAMESAFLDYCAGDMAKAEERYRSIISSNQWQSRWYPYFRLGEICLALEKVEDALVAFDQCEEHMTEREAGAELNQYLSKDHYLAKIGLAYSYWSLGKEFLPTVIDKMEEAKSEITAYLEHDSLGEEEKDEKIGLKFSLANNLCYYYLELWIDTPDSSEVNDIHSRRQRAEKEFQTLSELAKTHPQKTFSNVYDTLAWFCYQSSLQTKDPNKAKELRNQAKEYIVSCEGVSNKAPSRLTSTSILREHIQIIMSECI